MKLKLVYEKKDGDKGIPEGFDKLFTERDGKWYLTGIEGMKTEDDVSRVQTALTNEKEEHRKSKDKLRNWEGLDHAEVREKLDGYDELKLAAEGKLEGSKLNDMVEARIGTRLAPVERARDEFETKWKAEVVINEGHTTSNNTRTIRDSMRNAAVKAKVVPSAMDDALAYASAVLGINEEGKVVTKEGIEGVTPYIPADVLLTELQEKKSHWWPVSKGSGAGGGGDGEKFEGNPWTKQHWNTTNQGKIEKTQGLEKAKQMASSAGVDVYATKPKD